MPDTRGRDSGRKVASLGSCVGYTLAVAENDCENQDHRREERWLDRQREKLLGT